MQKELIGKKVGTLYVSSGIDGITLFLSGGIDIRIQRGYYIWWLCHEGKIVMASSDMYVQIPNRETVEFWPMRYEAPDTIDYDEHLDAMFEKLEVHIREKKKAAQKILENTTIVSFETNTMHDLIIGFSNGAMIEVFALTNVNSSDRAECNVVNIHCKETGKEQSFVL